MSVNGRQKMCLSHSTTFSKSLKIQKTGSKVCRHRAPKNGRFFCVLLFHEKPGRPNLFLNNRFIKTFHQLKNKFV